MNLQATLETENIVIEPLQKSDFEVLYQVASDPKIWEQHPNKDRWKKEEFSNFFLGAIQSKGAFKIVDKSNGKVMGSTRFYDYQPEKDLLLIGYTFYARHYWGKGINTQVKKLMTDYAFQFVSKIHFHIGAENIRSQIAIERLGAKKIAEKKITYFGEEEKLNFEYELNKKNEV